MKQISTQFFKNVIVVIFFAVFTFSSAIVAQNQESSSFKSKKNTAFTEQEIMPIVDGFVSQASGTFNTTLPSADLKRGTGFNREI